MSSDCIKLMPVAKTWKIIDVLFSTICKDPNFQEICLTLDPMLQARSGLSTMAHGFFHRDAKNVLLKVCCVFSNAVSKGFLPTHAYIVLCWFVRPLSSLQFSVYIFLSCTGRSWQSECKKEKTSVLAFKYKPKPWVTIVAWWHRIWYIIGRSDGFIIYKITFSWTIKYITWQVSSVAFTSERSLGCRWNFWRCGCLWAGGWEGRRRWRRRTERDRPGDPRWTGLAREGRNKCKGNKGT